MEMTLKELLAMKVNRKTCVILDNKTTELHKTGKLGDAAFYNLLATEIFVRLKYKSPKCDMEFIYKEFADVTYNESNGYTVKNPFKD